ncbi:MAG: 6-bladed beta-propeller [Rikenellaceae bacterium]|nr:6-bladed beta-propeller [Rikenellaceae bacterium]MCL2692511.1 6-bladed beta-propeller [Rikenellaceae bacterium]
MKNSLLFFAAFAVFVLTVSGCKNNRHTGEGEFVVYRSGGKDLLSSGVIKSVTLVPLETTDKSLIGAWGQVALADNGDYYVVDQQQSVYRFDAQGRFLSSFGRRGQGPQEYERINSFSFDDAGNPIIYSGENSAAYYFTREGEFVKRVDWEINFNGAAHYQGDTHLLHTYFEKNEGEPWRLLKVDNTGEIIGRYLEQSFAAGSFFDGGMSVFSRYGDAVYLCENLNSVVYRLEEGELETAFRFDFGRYTIPEDFFSTRGDNPEQALHSLFSRALAIIIRFTRSDEYILVEAGLISGIMTSHSSATYVYGLKNKRSENWRWFEYEINSDDDNMPFLLGSTQGLNARNQLVCLVDPVALLENADRLTITNPEVLATITEDDNHVILLCDLE